MKPKDTIKKEKKQKRLLNGTFGVEYTAEIIEQIADEMYKWYTDKGEDGKPNMNIFSQDFATRKQLQRQRFSEWAKKNEYFNHVYTICKQIEISKLQRLGMLGKNPVYYIFLLKNIAPEQFRDKQELEHTGAVKVIRDDI